MLNYFLSWYHGQVWPNLLASAICFVLAALWGYVVVRRLKKMHRQHHQEITDSLKQLHVKIDRQGNN